MEQALRDRLGELESELNRYLATDYAIEPTKKTAYAAWVKSHQPFHWFVEFYGIMKLGGFAVIIGNPPYVEYGKVKKQYTVRGYLTESCANLYAFMWEQSLRLAASTGRVGMIVPVASVCTEGYAPLQSLLHASGTSVVSNFNDRPSKLFDGLEHIRLSIILHEKRGGDRKTFASCYNKWQSDERPYLFEKLAFAETTTLNRGGAMAKAGSVIDTAILSKLQAERGLLAEYTAGQCFHRLVYTRKLSHFVQILDFVPAMKDSKGRSREPSELKEILFRTEQQRDVFLALLNSTVFYWLLTVYSDCRNLNKREVEMAKLDLGRATSDVVSQLARLSGQLMEDIRKHARVLTLNYRDFGVLKVQATYPRYSKPIIDRIDCALAEHYGFTANELDFIVNYDIKYRLGAATEDADE